MNLFPNLAFILSTIGFIPIGFFPTFSFLFLCWALRYIAFKPRYLTMLQISGVAFILVCIASFINFFFVLQNLGPSFDTSYLLRSIVSSSYIAVPFFLLFCRFNFDLQQFFHSICLACVVLAGLVLIIGFDYFISLDFISLRHLETILFSGWPTRVTPIFSIPFFYALYSLNGSTRVKINFLIILICIFVIFISGTRSVLLPVSLISVLYFFFSSISLTKKVIVSLLFTVIPVIRARFIIVSVFLLSN